MNTRLCPNGHVMDSTWDRCPYCPPTGPVIMGAPPAPGLPSRRPVPATIVGLPTAPHPLPQPPPYAPLAPAPAPPPPPVPVPAPHRAPGAKAGRTVVIGIQRAEEKALPVVGWLVVLSGKHKGEDFRLRDGRNGIGSEPVNQIVLDDDHISGRHATINSVTKDGERIYVLHDLDSRNGTFLNDGEEPVFHEELVDNDTVVFGTVRCKFKCL